MSNYDFPSTTCPECGSTSHHPDDIVNQYCGSCHMYYQDMASPNSLD